MRTPSLPSLKRAHAKEEAAAAGQAGPRPRLILGAYCMLAGGARLDGRQSRARDLLILRPSTVLVLLAAVLASTAD